MVRSLIILILLLSLTSQAQEYSIEPFIPSFEGNTFSPTYYKESIVFCSDRKDRLTKTVLDKDGREPVDLYIVSTSDPDSVERFASAFRTIYNDGPVSFSSDGTVMVISRNLKTDQSIRDLQANTNHLGLYLAFQTDSGWSTLRGLPFNSSEYNCSHPAVSADGKTIYFSSNMPGGYGGYDLWFSRQIKGKWSKPVNLGSRFNTAGDEFFPTVNGEMIYFSSDRGIYGGLDIYRGNYKNIQQECEVLPEPLNSGSDDFGLITSENLESGFLTSSRNGNDAIFFFRFNFPEFKDCNEQVKDVWCYTLHEENAVKLGEVGALVYQWKINEVELEGVTIDYCFPGPGDYEITLDVIDTIVNQTYFNQAYYFISFEHTEQPFISAPDTVLLNFPVNLTTEQSNLPGWEQVSYFWQFSDSTRFRGKTISKTFNQAGDYQIQLGATGVYQGTPVRACVTKSIRVLDKTALMVATYSNFLTDEASANHIKETKVYYSTSSDSSMYIYGIEIAVSDVELDLNDSILIRFGDEYEIEKEYLEDEQKYIYYVGQFENLEQAHPTWLSLLEKGAEYAVVRLIEVSDLEEVPVNQVFVMDNIQFDVAKWDIRPESEQDLMIVVELMKKFPSLMLHIDAHTDNMASEEYNLELSKKRAQSVKEFFIMNGIEPERLSAEGHGESQPIDTNSTDEGRQNNRRVEFTLTRK